MVTLLACLSVVVFFVNVTMRQFLMSFVSGWSGLYSVSVVNVYYPIYHVWDLLLAQHRHYYNGLPINHLI